MQNTQSKYTLWQNSEFISVTADVTNSEYYFHCFTVNFNSLSFTHQLMHFYI